MIKKEAGQVVIILLLTIVVALAIGLSISTRSISEISTATKTEQSSRAFSAAEAGIEKVLQDIEARKTDPAHPLASSVPSLSNQAKADISSTDLYPPRGDRRAIEYGYNGVGRDEVAHIWLADPSPTSGVETYYNQPTFDVYFGNPTQPNEEDKPAIEVNVITKTQAAYAAYASKKLYFDSKTRSNNFITPGSDPDSDFKCDSPTLNTIISANSQFYCRLHVADYPLPPANAPVLVRIRLLYSSTKQKIAVAPTTASPCNVPGQSAQDTDKSCSLPPQITLITSTGTSGDVTRKIQLFQQRYVIPPILNYALFSNSDIDVQ